MTNLAGHDMEAVLDAFEGVDDDQPTCFIAYTIKGYGLPFAGHKDNHAGLMTPTRWRASRRAWASPTARNGSSSPASTVAAGRAAGLPRRGAVHAEGRRRTEAPVVAIPAALPRPSARSRHAGGFGRILNEIAAEDSELARAHRHHLARRHRLDQSRRLGQPPRPLRPHTEAEDVFREQKVVSAQRWRKTPRGQHIELGIAENNLFILLAALGLATSCSARACCRSARSTIRSSRAASMR